MIPGSTNLMMIGSSVPVSGGGGPSSWTTSWSTTLDSDNYGIGGYSFRVVFTEGMLTESGTYIRVTFVAASGGSFIVDHASVGERTGSMDTTATPTELKFSGASGFNLSAGSSITSDALLFTLDHTKNYMFIFDVNSSGNYAKYRVGTTTSYYAPGQASWNVANVNDSLYGGGAVVVYGISKVEVGTV
jgi:hypothetical protein